MGSPSAARRGTGCSYLLPEVLAMGQPSLGCSVGSKRGGASKGSGSTHDVLWGSSNAFFDLGFRLAAALRESAKAASFCWFHF